MVQNPVSSLAERRAGGRKRALVVDDSATARVILKRMLESHGLLVDTAVSAEDALEQLKTSHPDVIFMDHLMPGMDGLEALKVIKDDPSTAMIPIMMYTSKGGAVYVSEARALGAVGVISKEVKPVELLNVLRDLHLVPEDEAGEGSAPRRTAQVPRTAEAARTPRVVEEAAPPRRRRPPAPTSPVRVEVDPGSIRGAVEPLLSALRARLRSEFGRLAQQVAHEAAGESVRRYAAVVEAMEEQREPDRRVTWALALAGMALAVALVGLLPRMVDRGPVGSAGVDPGVLLAGAGPSQGGNPRNDGLVASAEADTGTLVREGGSQTTNPQVPGALLQAVEWLYNANGQVPYDEPMLGTHTLRLLQGTVRRLADSGLKATLELHTHAARFCLRRTHGDRLTWPPENTALYACEMVLRPDTEQSLAFAEFLATDPALNSGQLRLRLVHHGTDAPRVEVPMASGSGMRAGEWNRIARENYRTELRIVREP
ncbi:MAG TPA: response regulator [Chromatiales bacterium]|nr:response regulator [Chromatiales bacterium]